MKPVFTVGRKFPLTDCYYQSNYSDWHSHSWDGEEEPEKPHNLNREFLVESAREQAREMAVLGVVVLVSAWPIIYMAITVIRLLIKGRP